MRGSQCDLGLPVPDHRLPLPFFRHLASGSFGLDLSFSRLQGERRAAAWQCLDDDIAPRLDLIGEWPGKDCLERKVAAHLGHVCARCPGSADQVRANVTQVEHAVQLA